MSQVQGLWVQRVLKVFGSKVVDLQRSEVKGAAERPNREANRGQRSNVLEVLGPTPCELLPTRRRALTYRIVQHPLDIIGVLLLL